MNTYVKIFCMKRENEPVILLYGYGMPDIDDVEREWSEGTIDKKLDLVQCTCVMSDEQKNIFQMRLESEDIIEIKESIKIRGKLIKRPTTIFYPKREYGKRKNSLLERYSEAQEYWNIDKDSLFQEIEQKFDKLMPKQQREKVQEILSLLSEKTALSFFNDAAERLGNVEFFLNEREVVEYKWKLEKISNKDSIETGYEKLVLLKRNNNEELIVNCILGNAERCILNKIKNWSRYDESLTFEANEPISEVEISIWECKNGKIIYYDKQNIIRSIQLSANIDSRVTFRIHDQWSEHIDSVFGRSKQKEKKLDSIQKVKKIHEPIVSKIGDFKKDPWNQAAVKSKVLASRYSIMCGKGAFCKKVSEGDCEVDSFLKISEYLNARDVEKAIIFDPYFSVYAMQKVLTRIKKESLQLEIVTSLTTHDPDMKDIREIDFVKSAKEFLERNTQNLHQNLQIINVTHNGKTAFHDRYLFLLKSNGKLDGYLLSNSLNSAGQNYSFVIAPMDQEVSYEVLDYIDEVKNTDIQAKKPKNQCLQIEVLWDDVIKKTKAIEKNEISKNKWELEMQKFYEEKEYHNFNDFLFKYWEKGLMDEMVLLRLSYFIYYSDFHTHIMYFRECLKWMKSREIDLEEIMTIATKIAKKCEVEEQQYETIKMCSDSHDFRIALNSNQSNSIKINEKDILRCYPHIFYKRYPYIKSLYELMFHINTERTLQIMCEIHSPMMFQIMLDNMTRNQVRLDIYKCLQKVSLKWLNNFSYYYLSHKIMQKNGNQKLIDYKTRNYFKVHCLEAVLQYSCLIEKISLNVENMKNSKRPNKEEIGKGNKCLDRYIEFTSEGLNNLLFDQSVKEKIFYFLEGPNCKINCINICRIWNNVRIIDWKKELEKRVIDVLMKKWSKDDLFYRHSDYTVTECASFMSLQYWLTDVKKVREVFKLNTKSLYVAIAPDTYDINYRVWDRAVKKVLWQLLFLKYYCKFWEEEYTLENYEYRELLNLQNVLRRVKRQCNRYNILPELAKEVF